MKNKLLMISFKDRQKTFLKKIFFSAITIFADLFNEKYRPLVLNVFMGGILLGGSLAYLLGPLVSEHLADVCGLQGWVWVTSGTGVVGAVFLIPAVFIVPDVPMQSPGGGAKKVSRKPKKIFKLEKYMFFVSPPIRFGT